MEKIVECDGVRYHVRSANVVDASVRGLLANEAIGRARALMAEHGVGSYVDLPKRVHAKMVVEMWMVPAFCAVVSDDDGHDLTAEHAFNLSEIAADMLADAVLECNPTWRPPGSQEIETVDEDEPPFLGDDTKQEVISTESS